MRGVNSSPGEERKERGTDGRQRRSSGDDRGVSEPQAALVEVTTVEIITVIEKQEIENRSFNKRNETKPHAAKDNCGKIISNPFSIQFEQNK